MPPRICKCGHHWTEHDQYGCQHLDGCTRIDGKSHFDRAQRAVVVDNDGMSFGQLLRALRAANGLTLDELADKLGVLLLTVDQYERDVRTPTERELQQLGYLLGKADLRDDIALRREVVTRALAAAADE